MLTESVIITTKNRKDELLKAVESAMAQRGLLEVVVIDDGSTDGTAEELKKKFSVFSFQSSHEQPAPSHKLRATVPEAHSPATRHSPQVTAPEVPLLDSGRSTLDPQTVAKPQLRLIRHEVSAGYIVRRNEGARVAKGDVIFSLDDDAVFSSPFVLEQTLRDFSHPRIGAVAIPYIEPHKANKEMQRAPTREDVWITASYVGTAHAVRRDVFLALGGYREHLVHQGEEGDFCLRMLAAEQKEKAESGNAEKLKTDLTTEDTTERLGGREMEQPKVGPKGEGVGTTESKSTEGEAGLTTIEHQGGREKEQPKVGLKGEGVGTTESNGSDIHGYRNAGPRLASQAGASESDSLASELADSPVSESRSLSASGLAVARIASGGGGMRSGGENQLAVSGEFLEGQSQAGLHMDSQKPPIHRVATGSDTSGENSPSVRIGEIRGSNSEALDSGRSTLDSAPLSAVSGFFVRLGNSDPIIHNESPKRDYSRMDFYGRRNDVLFHWQNTPMPDLLWQLPMTIAGGLVCAAKVGRWRKMLKGIGAGFLAIAGGVQREPVSKRVVGFHKKLKHSPQKF